MEQLTEAEWNDLWLKYHAINEKKVKGYFRTFNFYTVPKEKSILDIGCGSGETLKMLKKHGYTDLHGIEPEEKLFADDTTGMIEQGSILEMDHIKRKYDVILVFGVLHHLHTLDEIKHALHNIKDHLVLGGEFYSVEQWKNVLRSVAMKLVRDTPVGTMHPTLRIERQLLRLERKDLDHWLSVEREVTKYAQEIGLEVISEKKDLWRYRYIRFRKVRE